MVWSEGPVYWTIKWTNPSTFENAESQLTDMIFRDKNRASVIIWSKANEMPVSPERNEFLKKMITKTRSIDPIRLVSAALERHTEAGSENTRIIEDPLQGFVDAISFNENIGWNAGLPDDCKTAVFDIKFNKTGYCFRIWRRRTLWLSWNKRYPMTRRVSVRFVSTNRKYAG